MEIKAKFKRGTDRPSVKITIRLKLPTTKELSLVLVSIALLFSNAANAEAPGVTKASLCESPQTLCSNG